jgi:hypothetical protein
MERGDLSLVVANPVHFVLAASLGLCVQLMTTMVIKVSSATTLKVLGQVDYLHSKRPQHLPMNRAPSAIFSSSESYIKPLHHTPRAITGRMHCTTSFSACAVLYNEFFTETPSIKPLSAEFFLCRDVS